VDNKTSKDPMFETYFNPDDISIWLNSSPLKVMTSTITALAREAEMIKLAAVIINRNPDVSSVTISGGDNPMTVKDIMEEVIEHTLNIQRMLKTQVRYREAFLRGDVKPEDSP
jgi:hypothetical protein